MVGVSPGASTTSLSFALSFALVVRVSFCLLYKLVSSSSSSPIPPSLSCSKSVVKVQYIYIKRAIYGISYIYSQVQYIPVRRESVNTIYYIILSVEM